MPKLTFLPHDSICPKKTIIDVKPGISICEAALENGIEIEHACEQAAACTTCHIIIREGFDSIEAADEFEEDLLDKAWGLEAESRLSCQAIVADTDLVIEIPKYTLNQVSENH